MVLDKIKNAKKYYTLHPYFEKAFEFLIKEDVNCLDVGTYEIVGKDVYAIISKNMGKSKEEAKLEFHNKYIDIQLVIKGNENIGWRSRFDCLQPERSYDAEKDFGLCGDHPDNWLSLNAGKFAIFFPEDLHAPMVANDIVHKAVVKVRI